MSRIDNLPTFELFEELTEEQLESVVGGLSAGFYAVNGVVDGRLINPVPIAPGTQVSTLAVSVGDDGNITFLNAEL